MIVYLVQCYGLIIMTVMVELKLNKVLFLWTIFPSILHLRAA